METQEIEFRDTGREIVRAGRKLWERQYVDGSGGNISARLDNRFVLCTPAFCSKADLTLDDMAVVDMNGKQVRGARPRSSEILLHLEIYHAVSRAQAVIHCHPPHAMAYALKGIVPPGLLVPEYEVFIGKVALVSYGTPGTQEFAESIRPYARDSNMILLQNHGIVCWADTVTHAEWMVEVFDTYCRSLILAKSLGGELIPIPQDKMPELLALRRKLGLPTG